MDVGALVSPMTSPLGVFPPMLHPPPPPPAPFPPSPYCNNTGATAASVAAALQFFFVAQCISEHWPRDGAVANNTHFDFIVVGAGTAGATIATRLSENSNHTVLLIEAGPDPPVDSIIPGFCSTLKNNVFDWNLTTLGVDTVSYALKNGSQLLPRGKVLGGSDSISDMVYSRGFPADYDEWALTLGDDTWNWHNVLPFFKKTEDLTDENIIDDPNLMKLHGRHGEIEVSGQRENKFETDKFLQAFKEADFKIVKDMTNPFEIGAGRQSHTIKNGRRNSPLTGLLNKAANRKNLIVLKEALVTKILIENDIAHGVKVLSGNDEFIFYAEKDIIVSAGTFHTPKLLMLSGIGPERHLHEIGIEVIKDLPVGQNLHDHVMVLNYIIADNGTCYKDKAASHMDIIRYLYDQSGPYAHLNTMGAYKSFNPAQENVPDFGFYPTCIPQGTYFFDQCSRVLRFRDEICFQLQKLLEQHELITVAAVLLNPKSRGQVLLNSTNPLDAPLIYSGIFSNEEDLQHFPQATRVAELVANSCYFKRMNARVVDLDLEECQGLWCDELDKCRARATAMFAWHSVGTAAMGSVVDSRLRVKGFRGLRVVDASVMPKVIRGHTNAPVVMIAEKAAEFINNEITDGLV